MCVHAGMACVDTCELVQFACVCMRALFQCVHAVCACLCMCVGMCVRCVARNSVSLGICSGSWLCLAGSCSVLTLSETEALLPEGY